MAIGKGGRAVKESQQVVAITLPKTQMMGVYYRINAY